MLRTFRQAATAEHTFVGHNFGLLGPKADGFNITAAQAAITIDTIADFADNWKHDLLPLEPGFIQNPSSF